MSDAWYMLGLIDRLSLELPFSERKVALFRSVGGRQGNDQHSPCLGAVPDEHFLSRISADNLDFI